MNTPIFQNGITGLSDTKWSGSQGNAHKLVGVDFRSEPGVIKAHQKLKKISSTFAGEVETNIVTELCKDVVDVSDGTKLWFSSESGKIWQQTGDTFALIHTLNPVTDYKEPNSVVEGVWDDDSKENGITMSIAENSAGYGNFSDYITSGVDIGQGLRNSLIDLDGANYILAYQGVNDDGFIKSFVLSSTGIYTETYSLEHDTTYGDYNSVCKIDSTHFILAYNGGASQHGFIKTFSGPYVLSQVNSLEHDTSTTGDGYNSLIKIDATHYALAYAGGASNYGYIKIFTIDGSYTITQTSYLIHDNAGATYGHKLVLIDSTHFILSYMNHSSFNVIKTFSIDGAYAITQLHSLTQTTTGGLRSDIIQLDSTHYIWSGTVRVRGYVKVFTIDGSYNITETSELDIKSNNLYPSLLKNDETHIVLSSGTSTTGFTKSFEIDSSYKLRELYSSDFNTLATSNTSIIRAGKYILVAYSDSNSLNYISAITMNETYANGIILKPSGTEKINLIASKIISQESLATQYLKTTIKIPAGYDDMNVVVIAGRCGYSTYPPAGVTIAGHAMTQIVNRATSYGFACNSAFYNYVNPTVGDNEIIVDFTSTPSYSYLIVLVFKNVHQTTPYSATTDYGWQDYLELPGSTNGELMLGSFLTKINTHSQGSIQNELAFDNIAESTDKYTISVASRDFNIGTAKLFSAEEFSYTQTEQLATDTDEYIPEEKISKIYYCNENVVFAIKTDKISTWSTDVETIGVFKNGDDTYHSMVKQNLELYIGDNIVISKVDINGDFVQETKLNIAKPERIQVLSSFDTDILIGTKDINKARVLRWDTFSDSWIASDDVMETNINAFIKDDNYTYVSAGDYGRLYFYNGEKLSIIKRIPGDWDSTHKAVINENAVGYYMGNPVFGLSNSTGNPTEQGIYGFGNYSDKYVKSLSLDYPLPTNEFEGISIGTILVNGVDMYVSYKTATDVGVARIDHSNKYTPAYIETMMLTSSQDRDEDSIVEGICVDYISMPTNTSVSILTKTKYDTTYTSQTVITDTDKMTVKTKTIPQIANLQARIDIVSVGNNCPKIENIGKL